MRTIILFLVLVNLALFYWASFYLPGKQRAENAVFIEPQTIPGYKPIKLLSERQLDTAEQKEESSQSNQQVSLASQLEEKVTNAKCYSLGPFAQEDKSDATYEKLFSAGVQAKQRQVNERRPKSYWVYLPAHDSQKAAEKTVEFLKKNKIKEFYIWLAPPQKYAVSLGLFKKLPTARSKMDEIRKLGLAPEMEVRFDEYTEYWVDFNHQDEAPQPKIIEDMLVKNDRMLILETKCL